MDAQDAATRLPLPMGQILHTVSLSSISRLVARAVAISTVWRGPVAHPQRISYTVPYPTRPPGSSPLFPPLYGTVLPGNRWLLINMHTDSPCVYCLENGVYLPLVFEGTVYRYAFESSNNGAEIVLAVVKAKCEPHNKSWYVNFSQLSQE